jgi:hypothetical protein
MFNRNRILIFLLGSLLTLSGCGGTNVVIVQPPDALM